MTDKKARDQFVSLYMQGEADFLKIAGLNHALGMSYDGHPLHVESGELTAEGHPFSAASKESLHWGLMMKILENDTRTAPFGDVNSTFYVLDTKMKSYESFH